MNPLQIALSIRSDFSLGESSFQTGKIVNRAKELGYTHIALTDYMSVSAMPGLVEKAAKQGIEVITGCSLQVVGDPHAKLKLGKNNSYRLKVYAKSEAGVRSIFQALSKANTPENFYYNARLGIEDIVALEDVIVTSGDIHPLWQSELAAAHHVALQARFGEDYFVELVAIDTPLFDRINREALKIASTRSAECQTIIGRPAFYETSDDANCTDVLRGITTNTQMDSIWLQRPHTRDLCLLSQEEYLVEIRALCDRLSIKVAPAIRNVEALAAAATYRFRKLEPCLPKMADNEFAALVKETGKGWHLRFARSIWGHKPDPADYGVYKERLTFELGVLKKMGFSGYFLLVQDIVNWAKENGVLVGPGRGSVGGSLVAYLLGITDIDPIRFGLLFERFINPDRTDLPDADLDFMSGKRHMVIDYISRKYGADRVAGIVNFSTLGPASALRDTARLHGLSPIEYACSKQMEKEHGVSLSLTESAEKVPDIDRFKNERPVIWDHALRLEGVNRSLSQHAAGVVVAGEPVINRAVVSTRGGPDCLPIIQWDKRQVENFGLIKIDILGLNTLDLIDCAFQYIKERHHKTVDMLSLPLDDERVLKAFGKGETTGVFQFSGSGMKKLLRDMAEGGPLSFEDICAATALFRPGPLDAGLCDRYVQVKRGAATPTYDHPILEKCLSETFGVLTYQEQIMQMCRDLAGFTPGQADGVRKAMGKKDHDKMAEYETHFVAGAIASGMVESRAIELWETTAGFAGYGFNKSHAAEYSLISWVTMWIKVYYPAEFYAAAMTVIEKEDQLASLVADAQLKKLRVLPPDINISSNRIEIRGEDELYAPFQAIKGISSNVAAGIMKLRDAAGGRFTYEPATDEVVGMGSAAQKATLGRTSVNIKHRETLGRVGAFHSIKGDGVAPMHPDRLKDRLELMPGFTVDMVKPDRALNVEHLAKIKITSLIEEIKVCGGCSLSGSPHPLPRMGDKPKFMVVFDSPHWKEERAGRMLEGEPSEVVKAGLKGVGLKAADGYYTSLVKVTKPKDQKVLTNEQINGCSGWLQKEIDILKPPVIIAMGSNAIRWFAPGLKGSPADLAGKVIYRADLDATIIFGLNPGSLFHDASKITLVEGVFDKLAELLS